MLDFTLTPQQIELREKARQFAINEVLPVAWYYDRKDEIPMPVIRKAFDARIMNGDIPKTFGGAGLGLVEAALVTEEIAAACPGLATSIFDSALGMEPILLSENETAKRNIFPHRPGFQADLFRHIRTHHGIGRGRVALQGDP